VAGSHLAARITLKPAATSTISSSMQNVNVSMWAAAPATSTCSKSMDRFIDGSHACRLQRARDVPLRAGAGPPARGGACGPRGAGSDLGVQANAL